MRSGEWQERELGEKGGTNRRSRFSGGMKPHFKSAQTRADPSPIPPYHHHLAGIFRRRRSVSVRRTSSIAPEVAAGVCGRRRSALWCPEASDSAPSSRRRNDCAASSDPGQREAVAAEVSGRKRFFADFELVCAFAGVDSLVGVSIVAFFFWFFRLCIAIVGTAL